MKSKKNIVLFAIALLAVIALTGSAAADPAGGQVNSTTAEGQIVTLYLDTNPGDYVTTAVINNASGGLDYYYFDSIASLLDRNGYSLATSDPYNATIEMRCSGYERNIDGGLGNPYTNTLKNTTPTTAHIAALYDGNTDAATLMELESCPTPPDLNVTAITVNYDHNAVVDKVIGPAPHEGALTQCNNISAKITELNGVTTEAFNVTFGVSGTTICEVRVPSLAGGTNTTVYCNCSFYPYAGSTYTINVTADSSNEIGETDETNNTLSKDYTAVMCGYKGNHYQDGRNITTQQCHNGTVNLTYSVGDSNVGSGFGPGASYTANWTTSNLSVPSGATIEKARLYVYYDWDGTYGAMDNTFIMSFNGNSISLSANYSDVLLPGAKTSAKMLAYDVTNEFSIAGTDTAVLTNSYTGTGSVSIYGMLLVVVYNHSDESERIICINEGSDFVSASVPGAESWGWPADNGVSPEEAIAYAPFNVPISLPGVVSAKLITVDMGVQYQNGGDYNTLYFNDGVWKGVVDPSTKVGNTDLGINETDIKTYLKTSSNTAAFQSNLPAGATMGDLVEIMNAFLVVEYEEIEGFFDTGAGTYPSIMGTHIGTIKPAYDIVVNKMYTYPCAGTGGHTESIRIWGNDVDATGAWSGYHGDYHNVSLYPTSTLLANHTYNYTIVTGSYPQIHHTPALPTTNGWINCTTFTDANGREYTDWIPAIRLYYE